MQGGICIRYLNGICIVLSEILEEINNCIHIMVGVLLTHSPSQKLLGMAKDQNLDQLRAR